jgi:hypothetical protein
MNRLDGVSRLSGAMELSGFIKQRIDFFAFFVASW